MTFFHDDYFPAAVKHSCDQRSMQCVLYSFVLSQVADTLWCICACKASRCLMEGIQWGERDRQTEAAASRLEGIILTWLKKQKTNRLFFSLCTNKAAACLSSPTSHQEAAASLDLNTRRAHTRTCLDLMACHTHTQRRATQTRLGVNPPLTPRGLSAGDGKRRH